MMTNKTQLIIYAPSIHTGGGRVLLLALLSALDKATKVTLFLDKRLKLNHSFPEQYVLKQISGSLWGRFKAELALRKIADKNSIVLCFANLPPLFKLSAKTFVYLQNRHLLGTPSIFSFNFRTAIRLFIERNWLKHLSSHTDHIFTQTRSMQIATQFKLQHAHVSIAAFLPDAMLNDIQNKNQTAQKKHDFLCVTNNMPHKNNRILIEAWCLLATENIFPSLHITLQDEKLLNWVSTKKSRYNLNIHCTGEIRHKQLLARYPLYRALILPSLDETLALPLLEAHAFGIAIIASELDYARDTIQPNETFDPHSALSIARAVKRFLNITEKPVEIQSASQFIKTITE